MPCLTPSIFAVATCPLRKIRTCPATSSFALVDPSGVGSVLEREARFQGAGERPRCSGRMGVDFEGSMLSRWDCRRPDVQVMTTPAAASRGSLPAMALQKMKNALSARSDCERQDWPARPGAFRLGGGPSGTLRGSFHVSPRGWIRRYARLLALVRDRLHRVSTWSRPRRRLVRRRIVSASRPPEDGSEATAARAPSPLRKLPAVSVLIRRVWG